MDEKVIKLSKFKEKSVSRSQKIGQLEIELGKKNSKIAVIEKELEKKNRDIIQRALDSQELLQRLERSCKPKMKHWKMILTMELK